MALTINCPHCQAKVRAPESLVGKKVKCPTCKEQFTVEGEAPAPAPAPAAPEPLVFKQEAYTESKPSEPKDDDDDDDRDDGEEEKRPKRKASSGGFADFIFFRKMITPFVVQVLYFILTGLAILGGLIYMVVSLIATISTGNVLPLFLGVVVGSLGMLIYILLIRIYCEVTILFFRMYDVAKEIKEELEKRS